MALRLFSMGQKTNTSHAILHSMNQVIYIIQFSSHVFILLYIIRCFHQEKKGFLLYAILSLARVNY